MGLLDGILGGGVDVAAIARQVGVDPALAQKAVVALGKAHPEPGDTVAAASSATGLDAGVLGVILDKLGGEAALGPLNAALQSHPQAAGLLKMLDRDGDGNPLDDIAGMARGLFGKS